MLAKITPSKAIHWLGRQLLNREDPGAFFDPLTTAINPMWAQQYTPARVERITEETADTKTFVLKPAHRWGGFKAGQHLNVGIDINGVRRTRTFSLSSSPALWRNQGLITLTIKRLPGGLVTNWLHDELKTGDVIGLSEAFGDFLIPEEKRSVLFIAGGSGITPILSHLETMALEDYPGAVTLLYYVRTQSDVIGEERLIALRNRYPSFALNIITTHEGSEPRYLTGQDLDLIPGLADREIFLCGPKGLMELATDQLSQRGVSNDRQHSTFFAPPAPAQLASTDIGGEVTFSKSNLSVDSKGDANLLEIAEAAGLTPRHGCRMGICHQCTCTKTSGTVVNRLTGKTSGSGAESVQLCISVPQGPVALEA
ncbi:Stearoyl-CoA 9-desaturase electron transfer partner [Marinobacter litoralis]|uniref:Stearoyl-CoA 9-desaturase electron transfer partner n=1 Tax=Marinobacter litoralis TaxID=187981 RepID=A0A3M2RGC7_9GAMM|nr:ferredoxin reductase [Marinobacter litoralis]RMJ04298.1 Stearoyl-CoA 9-desaturase electron transfer partner [Marinobacter litoralis]